MQISKADTESAFIAMTTWGWERGLWQNKLLRRSQNVKKKMGASLKAVKAWLLFALAAAALHHRANKLLLLTMRIYLFIYSFICWFIYICLWHDSLETANIWPASLSSQGWKKLGVGLVAPLLHHNRATFRPLFMNLAAHKICTWLYHFTRDLHPSAFATQYIRLKIFPFFCVWRT